jgi:hypothetical protein
VVEHSHERAESIFERSVDAEGVDGPQRPQHHEALRVRRTGGYRPTAKVDRHGIAYLRPEFGEVRGIEYRSVGAQVLDRACGEATGVELVGPALGQCGEGLGQRRLP